MKIIVCPNWEIFPGQKIGDNSKNKGPVYVDVKGAVKHPNVYKMTSKDRVVDLLISTIIG